MGFFRIVGLSSTVLVAAVNIHAIRFGVSQIDRPFDPFDSSRQSDTTSGYLFGFAAPSISQSEDSSLEFGIEEIVPNEYLDRYQRWKDDLLSTDFGREQWDRYANNKSFLLKIAVSADRKFGAGTDNYKWDENGKLVGATITLGKNIDRGYPNPVYYPVMNSLSALGQAAEINGTLLASTKLAHEFGHVNSTAQLDGSLFRQQEKLMSAYYKIFLYNGYNTNDPRLLKLTGELGRQPIEIWEDREYWGEANAMRFLADRISKEYYYCSVLENIKRNVNDYARNYAERFDQIAEGNLPQGCHY